LSIGIFNTSSLGQALLCAGAVPLRAERTVDMDPLVAFQVLPAAGNTAARGLADADEFAPRTKGA
jgi:hypothetical protein